MKPEHQVSNLELSKRLKKLKVKQESQFYWVRSLREGYFYEGLTENRSQEVGDYEYNKYKKEKDIYLYSAYTVAELGEMLPTEYLEKESRTVIGRYGFWFGDQQAIYGDTEADARAKMLIYLIKNKLIDDKDNI